MEKKIHKRHLNLIFGGLSAFDLYGKPLTVKYSRKDDWSSIGQDFKAIGWDLNNAVLAYFDTLSVVDQKKLVSAMADHVRAATRVEHDEIRHQQRANYEQKAEPAGVTQGGKQRPKKE